MENQNEYSVRNMRITFLGTGTSTGVPYINCKCHTCISPDERDKRLRASVLVQSDDTTLLIDCGPDFRQQMLTNPVDHIDGVLVTHEHFDHVGGMDDLRPFSGVNVYAEPNVCAAIRRNMPYVFSGNYPGVPQIVLREMTELSPFMVGSLEVVPVRCWHASLPIVGYRIGKFAYMTDISSFDNDTLARLDGIDTLVVDALRFEPHFSHFSVEQAVEFARLTTASTVYFTHCAHHMGRHAEVEPLLPSGFYLAYDNLVVDVE